MTTTVLITGANRGIGRGLADALLKRPHHVVIAAVRDPSSASAVSLRDSPTADGSKVILVKIESTSEADPAEAVKSIQTQGITALDIVIANAGISGSYARVDAINVADMREMFEVNTLPVVSLFKAVYPLLQKSKNAKFVAITTNGASIVDMEENIPFILGSYGVSKAAVNYLTRRIHFENDWLTTFVINPGFAKTDMGNTGAKFFGLPEAFVEVADSVAGILKRVDNATKTTDSGKFFNYDGTEMKY